MGVSILQTSKAMDKIALQYSLDKKENIFTMHKICSPGIKVQLTVQHFPIVPYPRWPKSSSPVHLHTTLSAQCRLQLLPCVGQGLASHHFPQLPPSGFKAKIHRLGRGLELQALYVPPEVGQDVFQLLFCGVSHEELRHVNAIGTSKSMCVLLPAAHVTQSEEG